MGGGGAQSAGGGGACGEQQLSVQCCHGNSPSLVCSSCGQRSPRPAWTKWQTLQRQCTLATSALLASLTRASSAPSCCYGAQPPCARQSRLQECTPTERERCVSTHPAHCIALPVNALKNQYCTMQYTSCTHSRYSETACMHAATAAHGGREAAATIHPYSQKVSFPTRTFIMNHSIPAPRQKNSGNVLYTPSLFQPAAIYGEVGLGSFACKHRGVLAVQSRNAEV